MRSPFAWSLTEDEKRTARRFKAACRAEAARLEHILKQKEKEDAKTEGIQTAVLQ